MKRSIAIAMLLAAFVAAGSYHVIADEAGDQPKPEKKDKSAKKARVTKPWSELSSLSEDQKARITEIHQKAVDDIKEIQEREKQDIMALLTEEQKAELTEMDAKKKAEKKSAKKGPQKSEGAAAE